MNWVDPKVLDLTCVNPGILGLTGTFYFIGFGISSFLVPRYSDSSCGRRKPYIGSLVFALIFYLMAAMSNSIYFTIIWFFGIGLCCGGRVCVGLSYCNEFIPAKYHNLTSTICLLGDSTIMIY